ncbi:MAG: M28 family peptidase [Gemmatimonas sp.]
MPTSSARLSTTLLAAALLVPMVSGAQSAPLPPIIEDPRIQDVVASSSAERIRTDITALVNFGTRHTMSDTLSNTRGIGAARRWIFAEFEKISKACGGCLEVRYISDIVKGDPNGRIKQDINVVNVVAILRGTTEPNRVMVHTGDIDSRVTDVLNATSDSPGANDNASGIAALLEAARLMSKHKFAASVAWVALSSEEQGLQGGDIVAKAAQREGWRIDAVINNDMVGNSRGIDGVFENTKARVFAPGLPANTPAAEMRRILTNGGELDTPSRQLARYIDVIADRYHPNMDVEIIYRLDRYGRGGHHTPFFNLGAAAVRLMEAHEDYTKQHQDLRTENGIKYGDVLEGVDFDYAAKMTALDASVLMSLAAAPAAPVDARITGAVQPSPTLRWTASPSPDVAGYRIYWRKHSDVNWTRSRYVGNVTDYTLKNVIIDNYFFGIAAVGKNGQESLVAFPR